MFSEWPWEMLYVLCKGQLHADRQKGECCQSLNADHICKCYLPCGKDLQRGAERTVPKGYSTRHVALIRDLNSKGQQRAKGRGSYQSLLGQASRESGIICDKGHLQLWPDWVLCFRTLQTKQEKISHKDPTKPIGCCFWRFYISVIVQKSQEFLSIKNNMSPGW